MDTDKKLKCPVCGQEDFDYKIIPLGGGECAKEYTCNLCGWIEKVALTIKDREDWM